jgi:hypothetical protein
MSSADFAIPDFCLLIPNVPSLSRQFSGRASQKSLPIDPRHARSLQELLKRNLHINPQDWVFANNGGRSRGQQNILQRHLRPAALRAGVSSGNSDPLDSGNSGTPKNLQKG